jgi:hypothetical protein
MGLDLPARQKWAEQALQGLAFWIGHRQAMFSGYPLMEAALVAELCNLMQANRPPNQILLCEQQYRYLLPEDSPRELLRDLYRADLVVAQDGINAAPMWGKTNFLEIVIEVKRSPFTDEGILNDMKRLHEMLRLAHMAIGRHIQAWLFIISESGRPHPFVTERGWSRTGKHAIQGAVGGGWYVVRKTCKAAARFEGQERVDTAHYACLVEIFTYEPNRREVKEGG